MMTSPLGVEGSYSAYRQFSYLRVPNWSPSAFPIRDRRVPRHVTPRIRSPETSGIPKAIGTAQDDDR
jgi:hypothetical protein